MSRENPDHKRRMKRFSVLLLALCWGLFEAQFQSNQDNEDSYSSRTYHLISMARKLGGVSEQVANMEGRLAALEGRLRSEQVSHLKSLIEGQPRVAFSAALLDGKKGTVGPYPENRKMAYKKIFANIGNGFNPATGDFTTTVKGMYYFHAIMFSSETSNSVGSIRKNDVSLVSMWAVKKSTGYETTSNAVVVPLEVGDKVHVQLNMNRTVYDNDSHFNTFSGFLLFTM